MCFGVLNATTRCYAREYFTPRSRHEEATQISEDSRYWGSLDASGRFRVIVHVDEYKRSSWDADDLVMLDGREECAQRLLERYRPRPGSLFARVNE